MNIYQKILFSIIQFLEKNGFGEPEEDYQDFCKIHQVEKTFWGGTSRGEKFMCELCDSEKLKIKKSK